MKKEIIKSTTDKEEIKMQEKILLFPTTVYKNNINRKFTNDEINKVKKEYNNLVEQVSNYGSANKYVLNDSPFSNIKNFIEEQITKYFKEVIKPKNKDLKIYITHSWLIFTHEHENHHLHDHPNSYLSGVFYFDTLPNDCIVFAKKDRERLQIVADGYTPLNAVTWTQNVNSGDLLIFPSELRHSVLTNKTKQVRISLSFNTWISGKIGDLDLVSELQL